MQLFLSCGSEVTIYVQVVGYGVEGTTIPSTPLTQTFEVKSWTSEDEESFSIVEVFICYFPPKDFSFLSLHPQDIVTNSPSQFLRANFVFVSLQTTSLPCFPSGTFSPFDSEVCFVAKIL